MNRRWIGWMAAGLVAATTPAGAVRPDKWVHNDPPAFDKGKRADTVVSSLGTVRLGRRLTPVAGPHDQVDFVNALAGGGDGAVYAATSPNGLVLRIDGDQVSTLATLDTPHVFSLLWSADRTLLAGTAGEQAAIHEIDAAGKTRELWSSDQAAYVWAMARGADGTVYAATGPQGKLFAIAPDGAAREVFTAKQKNLLSMAITAKGMLIVGSDTDGIVYRVDPARGKAFALYDAPEAEISAVAVDAAGNVYAATASTAAAKPGSKVTVSKPAGRPDTASGGKPATTAPRASTIRRGPGSPTGGPTPPAAGGKPGKPQAGNAVYRIDPQGFVREVFKQPVIIYAMIEHDGKLLLATGRDGKVFQVDPGAEETLVLAEPAAAQVVSLLRTAGGELMIGTANPGAVMRVEPAFAETGTLRSEVLDAGQISRWGRAVVEADAPEGTRVTLATRSGNVADPDTGLWSEFSPELDAAKGVQIPSPSARFLQYRLTLTTTKPEQTPTVHEISLARQMDNLPPRIGAIQVLDPKQHGKPKPGQPPGPKPPSKTPPGVLFVRWQAADPNGDTMVYDLYFRSAGGTSWIKLADDQQQPQYLWDSRTVADGEYEIRLVARDDPDNPPGTGLADARISDPVVIDNTPPQLRQLKAEPVAGRKGVYRVAAQATDAHSDVTAVHYSIDSSETWVAVLPDDDLFDSGHETFRFDTDPLSPGSHRLSVRVSDAADNTCYVALAIDVPE